MSYLLLAGSMIFTLSFTTLIHAMPAPTQPLQSVRSLEMDLPELEPDLALDQLEEEMDVLPTADEVRMEDQEFLDWMNWEYTKNPDLLVEKAGSTSGKCANAPLKIVVNKSKQRLYVYLNEKAMFDGEGIKVSTGRRGEETSSGTFCAGTPQAARKSNYASKKVGHTVVLNHVVPFNGGQWLHSASVGGQNWLGQKRSAGCVRIDRTFSGKVFRLASQYRGRTIVIVK